MRGKSLLAERDSASLTPGLTGHTARGATALGVGGSILTTSLSRRKQMLNEIARSRLAGLTRKETLPLSFERVPSRKCPDCGFHVGRRSRKSCPRPGCKGVLPPKPPLRCRLCDGELSGRRTSWCSDECSDAYYILTSSSFLRVKIYARDKGICKKCGLDCEALERRINMMNNKAKPAAKTVLFENGFSIRIGAWCDTGSLWDADHIDPLNEGGSWELSNVQTLCSPCHKEKTAEQASRRAKQRKLIGHKAIDTNKRLKLLESINADNKG